MVIHSLEYPSTTIQAATPCPNLSTEAFGGNRGAEPHSMVGFAETEASTKESPLPLDAWFTKHARYELGLNNIGKAQEQGQAYPRQIINNTVQKSLKPNLQK